MLTTVCLLVRVLMRILGDNTPGRESRNTETAEVLEATRWRCLAKLGWGWRNLPITPLEATTP